MGIGSILGSALQNVSWNKVASLAMEYAPELYRKARERFQHEEEAAESIAESELHKRISRLEQLLLEQEAIIREQVAKTTLLEETCISLESRLFIFKVISGSLLLVLAIILFILMK